MSKEDKGKYEYDPDYAVAPGETLLGIIEALGMTKENYAKITGIPLSVILGLLSGECPITNDIANKLEGVTGMSSRLWINLERQYREKLKELKDSGIN